VQGNIRFLISCHGIKLKAMSSYRVDAAIGFLAALLHDAATILLLAVVFANIRQLQGWSYNEILFIWGFAVITRNLGYTFFDIVAHAYSYIARGEMDRALVRPRPILLQMAAQAGFNTFSIGRTLIGIAALAFSLRGLRLEWWAWIYLPTAVASAVLLHFSIVLLIICLSVFFIQTFSLYGAIVWVSQFGQYPVEIFSPPLQFLFIWVIPYAMMGFIPAAFLLRGAQYALLGLIQPALGAAFLAVALLAWRAALRHYGSTGS
jgi:ABC-2 type transport system permease protein